MGVAHENDDGSVAHPEILTLHWEGPLAATPPSEVGFPDSRDEEEEALAAERERELAELRRTKKGKALWEQIQCEARRRGDEALWRRKVHAYYWVKMNVQGSAGDYARAHRVNHATVRSWISDVAKLAYQVGYRLHEDKLLLVGEAPAGLQRLRRLVNRDAASPQAWQALVDAEAEFRGEDPYFHLNEGHILRAHHRLRESDATLAEGLTIAEAHSVRSLLWNARGQTMWDCGPDSDDPLPDHLERAEKCFRRAAALDPSTYFPFVNLAQMAVDAGDLPRAEYWVSELAAVRKRMDETMHRGLARYLDQAEWTRPVEEMRFWKNGPRKWLCEAVKKGFLPVLALVLVLGLSTPPASGGEVSMRGFDTVAHGGGSRSGGGNNSGAGGN
jgi:tetratricopeptide (TPR) repeat protein